MVLWLFDLLHHYYHYYQYYALVMVWFIDRETKIVYKSSSVNDFVVPVLAISLICILVL